MAFERQRLDPNSSGSSGLPTLATYFTETETLAQVTAANYFDTAWTLMRRVSVVRIIAMDGSRDYEVSVDVTTHVVTLSPWVDAVDASYQSPVEIDGEAAPLVPAYVKMRETITPEEIAPLGKGPDEDWLEEFNACVEYFKSNITLRRQQGGEIYARGQYLLSDTLEIASLGVGIRGVGWGNSSRENSGTLIRAAHAAPGSPIIRAKQTIGFRMRDIRLGVSNANAPSYGIEFQDAQTDTLKNNSLDHVFIGQLFGYDSGDLGTVSCDVGIGATGLVNGDSNNFNHVVIYGANTYGVDILNPNFSDVKWTGLYIYFVDTCFRNLSSEQHIDGCFFGHYTEEAFMLRGSAQVFVEGFQTEKAARLMRMDPAAALPRFVIRNSSFQVQDDVDGSGGYADADGDGSLRLIDTSTATKWLVRMEDFKPQFFNYSGGPVKLKVGNHSGGLSVGTLIVDAEELHSYHIDAPAVIGPNDLGLKIFVRNQQTVAQDTSFMSEVHGSYTEVEDRTRNLTGVRQIPGRVTVFGGGIKVKRLIAPTSTTWGPTAVGGSGTTYSYRLCFLSHDGTTEASAALTCSGGAVLSASVYNRIGWYWPLGCVGVKIYGRTGGAELLLKTLTWDEYHAAGLVSIVDGWRDDGTLTPSGAFPTVNTTGLFLTQGRVNMTNLPTADPLVVGDLWNNGGVLTVSAG